MSPAQIASILEENRKLHDEVAELKRQLEWFNRQVYGTRSERFVSSDAQTELPLGVGAVQPPAQVEKVSYERSRPVRHTPHSREDIPEHLPRTVIELLPDGDVNGMTRIGEKVTEQLEYSPPRMTVNRYVRPVFAGDRDGQRTVLCAELPPLCNEKGKYGASLIAQVTVAKFEDHLPVYRQRKQILRDCGVDIAENSLDALAELSGRWLDIIAQRCLREVMNSGYMQMDESHIKVMIKPTAGKSTTGQMWLRHSPEKRIVVFDYDRHRSTGAARRLLKGYRGILQTDGYAVYDYYDTAQGVLHACCHGHARRKFEQSLRGDRKRAEYALGQYRRLFEIEQQAQTRQMTAEQRLLLRREESAPIITELKGWMDEEFRKVKPKSPIGRAICYALNHWEQLTQILENGRIELSNNFIENCVRPLALGRKNWLFTGSEDAARGMATIYTVLSTCRLHRLNTRDYLTDLLRKLPGRLSNDIEDLLPWNWKPAAL